MRQVLDEHPVFALPELAGEIDARLAYENQVREEDLPVRFESYLRGLQEREPREYGRLLAGCAEYLLKQHVRSRQASMRAVELGELGQKLRMAGQDTACERPSQAPALIAAELAVR